ncbi:MAG: hypothetical protein K2H91_08630 [Lachnospiraceae bacterium]|nr:hypothetical protein [Lachnospiraceae bacterium]
MLAILLINMEWTKESRTPKGAVQREKYYQPVIIEEEVPLSGDGIFLKRCNYYQERGHVSYRQGILAAREKQYWDETRNEPFTGYDEYGEKRALKHNRSIQRDRGTFYDMAGIEKVPIPCIHIDEETDSVYRVKWYDCEMGMPRRRGGNEDLYRSGAKLAGRPNVLNETAFILQKGESGVLKYNYRLSYYNGQWYECYYVYMVNADTLTRDVFMRTYDYEYDQLADLF